MSIIYGSVLFLNFLLIFSAIPLFDEENESHHLTFNGRDSTTSSPSVGLNASSSTVSSPSNSSYVYPLKGLLSSNQNGIEQESESGLNSTIKLLESEKSRLNSSSTQSSVHRIMKRGIFGNLFGSSSNTTQASVRSSSSSSFTSQVNFGGIGHETDLSGDLSKTHRQPRGAQPARGHRYQSYAQPPYFATAPGVHETTTITTTTTTPVPRKVLICIVDGKVVELEDKGKSCPESTTAVAPKFPFELKPAHFPTAKPLDGAFTLPNLFHH